MKHPAKSFYPSAQCQAIVHRSWRRTDCLQLTQRAVIGALMSLRRGKFTRQAGAFLVVRNLRHADVGADFFRVAKRVNRAQHRAPGVAEQYHFVFVKTPLDQFDDSSRSRKNCSIVIDSGARSE